MFTVNNKDYTIRFDGLLLKQLRDEHNINLSDLGAGDYAKIENDPALLTVAVCCLCADQLNGMTRKQFSQLLTGEVLESALKGIWDAAKVFFPARHWSALQSNFQSQQEAQAQWAQLRPSMLMLNQPDLPAPMKDAIMGALTQMMSGASQTSEALSAIGPAETPSKPA